MNLKVWHHSWIAAALVLGLFSAPSVRAEAEPLQPVAVVKEIEGKLDVLRGGNLIAGETGQSLFAGDQLVTKEADRALLEFASDKSLVKLTHNSTLLLTGQEEPARMVLIKGLMWGKKEPGDPVLRIQTPLVILAVRGTEYFVKVVSPAITEVVVKEGEVEVNYEGYQVRAGKMSRVVLEKGKSPLVEGVTKRLLNEEWVNRFA
ncbi:MAG: FecR domain-containing protein [Candidatus Omnitrophica bacterium]|nr:FecR domain-containing protein [Candidatus Omnitrophota bacterium]